MYKVLVVEDEFHIRQIIKDYFSLKGIEVIEASQGYEALSMMDDTVDLILLDIMMPGIDGYEVCKQLRLKTKKPIIFISALSEEENQLMAFELGADDYVMKPFQPSILYAKVVAMIKRDQKQEEHLLVFGHVQLDRINRILIIDGEKITLAHKEYELLEYMCLHVNQLLSRQVILDKIWGYDYYGDGRAVDTYVKKVRKKLGKYAGYIQTVIKTGYIFKVVDDDEKTKDNNR
ncbi:response regulator transcription factor [Clostridium sp. AUH-JLR23]|uniref:response regulator transcription factor n=1 Tax=Clostridium sp. AUH-JLR23 TaxID=1505062 RepID=UPI00356756E7